MNSIKIELLAKYIARERFEDTPKEVWEMYQVYDKTYTKNRKKGFIFAQIEGNKEAIKYLISLNT